MSNVSSSVSTLIKTAQINDIALSLPDVSAAGDGAGSVKGCVWGVGALLVGAASPLD